MGGCPIKKTRYFDIKLSCLGLLVGILACCSVIYSQKIKGNFQLKFALSGGTIMAMIVNVKSIMVGNRDFGNLASICGSCAKNED